MSPRRVNPTGDRLVAAAKTAHETLGDVALDLSRLAARLTAVRRDLAYTVTSFDSGAVVELPDDDEPRD